MQNLIQAMHAAHIAGIAAHTGALLHGVRITDPAIVAVVIECSATEDAHGVSVEIEYHDAEGTGRGGFRL